MMARAATGASKYEAVRDRVNAILDHGGNVASYSLGCHPDAGSTPIGS